MWGLSNRELATLIWLAAFVAFALTKPDIRGSFAKVVEALLHRKVIGNFALFGLYITAFVWLLAEFGLWDTSLLKDTISWWLISGTVLILGTLEAMKDSSYFKKTFLELFSLNAFMGFYFELQSFPVLVELLLQPFLVLLVLMIVFSRTDARYARTLAFLNYVFALVFWNMLVFTAWYLVRDFSSIDSMEVLRSFSLPIVLTTVALPYVFVAAVVATYEDTFLSMRFRNSRKPVSWRVKVAVIMTFRGDIYALRAMDARCISTIARTKTYCQARAEAKKCRISEASEITVGRRVPG